MADAAQIHKDIHFDILLDVSGLNCPLPILKTKATLARMQSDQVLKVIATHPDTQKEFPILGRMSGVELLESRIEGEKFIYFLRKTF